jgi:hypothetical protein
MELTPNISAPNLRRKQRPVPQRYRWFDQWKTVIGPSLQQLVEATISFVDHHEQHYGLRKRARRKQDAQNHRRRIEAIVCNLAYAVLMPCSQGRIAVPLGHGKANRSRYDSPVMGKLLSPTLSLLWELNFLDLKCPSVMRGEVSSIAPSDWFADKVREAGVTLADFGRHEHEELILLNRNTRRTTSSGKSEVKREPINYADTEQTHQYRADLRDLNAYLASAPIEFLGDRLEPCVDPFDRTLRRHFVILSRDKHRFDRCGRLFGGFWQKMKSDRRSNIRICGEEIAVLDYTSMFTRLAYAELGVQPPPGDLYAISGLEDYRSGVKLAMNSFLFDGGRRDSWPTAMGIDIGNDLNALGDEQLKLDAVLPEGWTVKRTRDAILHVHPALEQAWGRRLGFRLMFRESEIMMDVLKELVRRNVPGLPIHDAIIVPRSARLVAKQIMGQCAYAHTGSYFPVTDKT